MRKLIALVSTMAVVQSVLFSALAPLLPSLEENMGLSKRQVGVLVATFSVGMAVVAIPAGVLASRLGVKYGAVWAMVVLGMASLGFGLAEGYCALLATRFFQGAGAALGFSSIGAWLVGSAPSARRGEMIGLIQGARSAGQTVGPVIGGIAVVTSRASAFAAVSALAFSLAMIASRAGSPRRAEWQSLPFLRAVHGDGVLLAQQWFVFQPGVILAVLIVLTPLQLRDLGWAATGIATVYLVAALATMIARVVVGRLTDRYTARAMLRWLLIVSSPAVVIVPWIHERWIAAGAVTVALTAAGILLGPSMTLVSESYARSGVSQVVAFSVTATTVGISMSIASTATGELAHQVGDEAAYLVAVILSLLTAWALRTRTGPRRARLS